MVAERYCLLPRPVLPPRRWSGSPRRRRRWWPGVARGLSNKEIADELGKATGTVKSQLVSVYRKLGVRSRIQLMVLFRP